MFGSFYKLFKSVLQFLENNNDALRVNLTNSENDIMYLTDLFKKFNETNLQLQGDAKQKLLFPRF